MNLGRWTRTKSIKIGIWGHGRLLVPQWFQQQRHRTLLNRNREQSSSYSNIINILISKKLPSKLSEDERRRAFSFSLISLMSWDHGSIDRSTFHHLPASSSTGSYLSIGLPRCSHGIAIVSVDGDQNEASTLKKCWKLDQNFKHQRNMGIRWEKIGKLADFAIQWSNVIQLFNVIRWSENAWQISPPKSWCRETRCNLVPRQKSNTSDRKWLGHVNVSKLAKGKCQQHVNTMPTNRNRLDSLDPWWLWDNHDMHVQVLSKSWPWNWCARPPGCTLVTTRQLLS